MMEELYSTQLQADLAEFDRLVTYVSMKEGLGPEDAVVKASSQTNAAQEKLSRDFPEDTNTLADSLAYMNNLYKPIDVTPTSPNMDASQMLEQETATNNIVQAQNNGIQEVDGIIADEVGYSLPIRAEVLSKSEGDYESVKGFHKPTTGSGWTIANGIDFAHTSRERAAELGVPERLLQAADEAGAWGTTEVALPSGFLDELTQPEYNNIRNNIVQEEIPFMQQISVNNPGLSHKGVAYIAQIQHWAGDINTSSTAKIARKRSNIETGTAAQYGETIRPLKDLLDTGNATDESLVEVLTLIRDSYDPWEPVIGHTGRYNTLTRYIEDLED